MTATPPLHVLVGPASHGVVQYGADLAAAARRQDDRVDLARVERPEELLRAVSGVPRAHLQVTDRLLGASPEAAADLVAEAATRTRLTVTVHDVPQPSDGTVMMRRVAAYARILGSVEAAVVNSAHEVQLVTEFLGDFPAIEAIPLGARVAITPSPPALDTVRADLTVLIAGYIYPGKGHGPAIAALAEAAAILRARGEHVGALVVRSIGGVSPGHDGDADALRAEAERRGVRLEITGYLDDDRFSREISAPGIPLAAHEHVSASRSMLDWVEAGRRPLVVSSRYATEMERLRPGTLDTYTPSGLARLLADRWRAPASTWLPAGTPLSPTLDDAASAYLEWWRER